MKTPLTNEKIRSVIVGVSTLLNKNTGWLIAAAIVVFGLMNLGFAKDNKNLLSTTKNTLENTQTLIANLDKAVRDVKADNQQKTIVLCLLILRGDVRLQPDDEAKVLQICQEQVSASASKSTPSLPPTPTDTSSTTPQANDSNNTGNGSKENNEQSNNPLNPAKVLLDDTINALDKGVTNFWWGITHLERNK